MLLTYDEYINMGGSLEKTAFDRFNFAAERDVNAATFNRVLQMSSVPKAVKRVVFELIELNATSQSVRNGTQAASESVDKWSKSYSGIAESDILQSKKDLLLSYLSKETDDNGTPLLYCGVG